MIDMSGINALLAEGIALLGDWEHPEDQPCRCCGSREPRTERGDMLVLCQACADKVDGKVPERSILSCYEGQWLLEEGGYVFHARTEGINRHD